MEDLIGKELYEEEDTQKDKYLTFKLENESYGIEIKCVTEIIGIQPFTKIPELPEYIRGIINLRGKIIPVMDVRLRFKKPFKEYNDRTCIIVIDINDINVGLIVDSVADVHTIHDADIVPPPELSKNTNRYIKGIGKISNDVELLLDCNKLLKEDEVEALADL
ncbi:MAG: CheW protein [Herbinix sp.]|jgi:purine-binding chemotaxis protein CheW|nr:CheW protein [Herbinix sp.]